MNNNAIIGVVALVVIGGGLWWFFASEDRGWDSEYAKQWHQDNMNACMHGDEEIEGFLADGVEYNEAFDICNCMIEKAKMYDSPDEADAAADNMSDSEMMEVISDCF